MLFSRCFMKDSVKSGASSCLLGFLKDTSQLFDMKRKVMSYHKRVTRLQSKMKDYLFKYEYRLGALEQAWEKLKADFIKDSLTKKASKKLK